LFRGFVSYFSIACSLLGWISLGGFSDAHILSLIWPEGYGGKKTEKEITCHLSADGRAKRGSRKASGEIASIQRH